MSPALFQHTVTVAQPPAEIWEKLQHGDTWASIGPVENVWDATHNGDGSLSGFVWSTTVAGRHYRGHATALQNVTDQLVEFQITTAELQGTLGVAIAPSASSTDLTVSLSLQPIGAMASLFFGVIKEAVRRGLPGQVEAFGASLDGSG